MSDPLLDPTVRPGSGFTGKHFSKLPIIIASSIGMSILFGIVYGGWHRLNQQNSTVEEKPATVLANASSKDWFGDQSDGYIDANQAPPPLAPPARPPLTNNAPPPLTDLEKIYMDYQLARVKEYFAAIESDPTVKAKQQGAVASSATSNDPIASARSDIANLQQLIRSNIDNLGTSSRGGNKGRTGATGLATGSLFTEAVGNTTKGNKLDFLDDAAAQRASYLRRTRTDQIVPFEIKTGTLIPGVMISGLNSDLPGDIIAQVSEPVYDTATGQYLLIPQGTRLYGTYDSGIAFGQNRALAVWTRLIYPDGSTLELEGMQGYDKSGYSGYKDKVNNHYLRLFGSILLVSVIKTIPDAIDQKDDSSINSLEIEFAGRTESAVTEITRKNLEVQPTIEIRPGYKFSIIVNKDMAFNEPYRPRRSTTPP